MSTTEIADQLEALPLPERAEVIQRVLVKLSPQNRKDIERFLRRLAHPDIPSDFWEAWEEEEDGQAIEMKEEHFFHPPV